MIVCGRYIFALGLTVAAVLNVLLISFAFIRLWNVAGETEIAAVEVNYGCSLAT